MNPLLIPGVVFVAIMALIVGAYWAVVLAPEARGRSALKKRLTQEDETDTTLRLLKKEEVLSHIGAFNTLLNRVDHLSRPLKITLDHAGLRVTVGTFVLLITSSFFAAMLVANAYTGLWWIGLVAGSAAALIPYIVVRQRRAHRINQFEEQFPEAVELIARAMRAGHAFSTGLKMASEELPAPAGIEFKLLFERQNYGAQLPDALKNFADRIPSLDARFFVTAVLTQREAGGNLAEVLDRLAAVMRERFRIKREVRVRSAHGRITAFVLAAMPPAIGGMMLISNPQELKVLITDPLGIRMIIVAVVLQITGMLVVRKLVDIEY